MEGRKKGNKKKTFSIKGKEKLVKWKTEDRA